MKKGNYPVWLEGPYSHCDSRRFGGMRTERILIEDACSRVAAETVQANGELPRRRYAEARGYALQTNEYGRCSMERPIKVEADHSFEIRPLFAAADSSAFSLKGRQALYVPNGVPLPWNANAVIPFPYYEDEFEREGKPYGTKLRLAELPPHQFNVFGQGEDYQRDEVLVKKGQRITARTQAILIAAGVREIVVSKRPRIGVVVSSFDQVAASAPQEVWQRPDSSGPYIRSLLRQWGYDVSAVEYIEPCERYGPGSQDKQIAFEKRLKELTTRYDLIIGAGLPDDRMFAGYGLNRDLTRTWSGAGHVKWSQTPGNCFYLSHGDERSPTQTKIFPILREDGSPWGSQAVTYRDIATLISLPGFTSEVAMLMHVIVPCLLDEMEYVTEPGPYWETGTLAQDIACDAKLNRMLWATLDYGAQGETLVQPFDSWHRDRLKGFVQAEALVAIPAGATPLRGGSAVHFLRLDRTAPPTGAPRPVPVLPPATWLPPEIKIEARTPASASATSAPSVSQSWARLDELLEVDPTCLPTGLNPPATEAEIAALQESLGVTLPEDFVASLRIHNGQVDRTSDFFEDDSLLDVKTILAQWTTWRELVEKGAFEDIKGEPHAGIRDDWYHLQWIPFTSNGCGDQLCLDLAPAEGGIVGQVIRVWHDEAERTLEARSFAEWLHRIVADKTAM